MSKETSIVCLTGATGFIGGHLVPALIERNYLVRVITSKPENLTKSVPENCSIYAYEDAEVACKGADIFIHLASRNNDQGGSLAEFTKDNVDTSSEMAKLAQQSGVNKFLFATSTHALSNKRKSNYAQSKRLAEKQLENGDFGEMKVCIFRLPPVYGNGSRGTLSKLDCLPEFFRTWTLRQLRSLAPIASVEAVTDGIIDLIERGFATPEKMLSDPIRPISVYTVFKFLTNAAFVFFSLLLLPVLFLVGILIAVTSKGGVLFFQKRMGTQENIFTCIKFRTMSSGTAHVGTHDVNPTSVTKIGAFIRKAKIDEFPQAVNILRGEMNLIGPRPSLPNQKEVIQHRKRQDVFHVAPGITGLAQTCNIDMSTPEKLAVYDQRYIASMSVLTDLKIIKATALGNGAGDLVKEQAD